jgi:photosynthetic reaction center H subunit
MTGQIMGNIDVAQIVLYAFWIFFAGLIFYIRREDRREGYPLEDAASGAQIGTGVIWVPDPKPFHLASGETVYAPNGKRDTRTINAEPVAPWPGAPLEPIGNPLLAGVGPGSWAERADVPDVTPTGAPRIVPIDAAPGFAIESRDPDPRGLPVLGGDGKVAGHVTDVWIDVSESLIRYLEASVGEGEGARKVMIPMMFAKVCMTPAIGNPDRGYVDVPALMSTQFGDVPGLKAAGTITLLEEEKVSAYFGAGTLYATPSRQEPFL